MNEDRFTIGAAKNFVARKRGGYTRYNPRLKIYRILETPDYFALEKFLHTELAAYRITNIRSESWYELTSEQMDAAIERAETFGREHVARKKRVAELKRTRSNGRWIQPTERLQDIYARLASLLGRKQEIANEMEQLKFEAMVSIGDADGVDGVFEWRSTVHRKFQGQAFKKDNPELYENYRAETIVRTFRLWGGLGDEDDSVDD